MALVYRVNINFCSLFNTFSSKSVSTVKRFTSQYNYKNSLDHKHGKNVLNPESFDNMIRERQAQARKSIIIKINSFGAIERIRSLCESYGFVRNMFPYTTINNQCFVLIEFEHRTTVQRIRNGLNKNTKTTETVHMVSPIFNYLNEKSNSSNSTFPQDITYYKAFTIPEEAQIVKQLKSSKTIDEQMISLYYALKFSDIDIRLRFFTANEITYYLNRLFINTSVVPFGSSVNGFGQTGCDLDLVCTICGNRPAQQFRYLTNRVQFDSKEKHQQFLEIIYVLLNTCVPTISNIKRILNARVPILKFNVTSSNMKCDLSGPNVTAWQMSKLLYIFSEMDYRVKPLVYTIRKWAKVHQITKEHPGQWITNFSLTLLVIFYLQRQRVLPSINELNKLIDDIVAQKSGNRTWTSPNSINLYDTLFGFFQFYNNFDFKMLGICIREGKMKRKIDQSPVYIYNPFSESVNISKNINQIELTRLIHHFHDALYVLTNNDQCSILQLLKYDVNTSRIVINSNKHSTKDDTVQQKQSEIGEMLDLTKFEKVKEIIKT